MPEIIKPAGLQVSIPLRGLVLFPLLITTGDEGLKAESQSPFED